MNTQPNVKSFSATDGQGNPLRISVSTDIVDYMDSARTFGREDLAHANAHSRFQRRLIAIPDRKYGVVTPMVLSIGSNNGLYLVRKEDGAAGDGWTVTDLGQSFASALGGKAEVRAVGAAWTDDDRITVAVAVDGGDSTAPSRVFAAFDLTSQSDWSSIAWTDCGTRDSVRVSGIRVLDEGDGQWTVVLDGSAGRVYTLYLVRSSSTRLFDQANVFNPPVDYQEVFDFDVAIDPFVGSGIVLLGQSGRTRVLSFRPFPRYRADGRAAAPPGVVPLPCPAGANVLATGLTRDGGTDLYIGGQGVHTITADDFDNQARATLIPVMSADAAPDVRQLCVADAADGSVAAYALLQSGTLVVARRGAAAEADAGWHTPLRVRKDVQDVAPVHGDQHARTSLLIVRTDGSAAVLLQDAGTGVWRESPLLVSNPNELSQVSCFGTTLRVIADGALPRASTSVKVSASVLTSVVLNNRNVFIGPGMDAETQTDANGSVCLYDRARSLTPAVYRFTVDGLSDSIDVNPAGGVHERFRTLTGEDLRTATVTTTPGQSEPLLPEEFRSGANRNQVDGMASALNQVAALAAQTTSGPVAGVTQTRAGAAFSSRLNPGAMSDGYQWAIQADANGIRPAPQQQVDSILSASTSIERFFTDMGDTLADFFEGLWERIKEGWTFVVRKVQDAVEFICALGDKIKKFVLSTLEEIGSFFTWLWDQVKAGLEKVWNYLKFVFDWDDILVARDVMVRATDEALTYLKDSTGMLKDKTRDGFDKAIAEVQRWEAEMGVRPVRLPPPAPGTSIAAQVNQAGAGTQNILDQATGNSVVGWVMQRLDSVMDEIILIEGPSPAQVAVGAAKDFVTGLIDDQYNNLLETWQGLQADIANLFDGKMPSADALSFDTLKNLFVAVGARAVVGLLSALRDIVLRAIDLLGGMIEVVRSLLFSKVRFPFIEKLVELIAPGTNLDTSFRLVDGLMLLVSIPATITYKLIFNEAPFAKGEQVTFPFGRVAVQSSVLDTFKGFAPYVGIAGAFLKLAKGTYATLTAMIGDFAVGTASIVGGVVFGAVGVIAQVFGRYDQEGDTVTALEWAAVGAGALALAVTIGTSYARWSNPIGAVVPTSHKAEAWMDLFSNVAQIGLGAAVFGVIIDRLRKSSVYYDQVRQLPESYKWTSEMFDNAGTILTDIATIVPIEQPEAKLALIGVGAAAKGGHLTFRILQVVTTKYVLEPARA